MGFYINYMIKKIVYVITLLIAVSVIAFGLVALSPIDPVQSYVGAGSAVSPEQREEIREYYGLNKTGVERFFDWSGAMMDGDWGMSMIYRRSVLDVIKERFINSLALMSAAWLISGMVGFGIGIFMGIYNGSGAEKALRAVSLFFSSTPAFWLGLLLIMVFSVWLKIFPFGLSVPAGVLAEEVTLSQRLSHLVLPVLTLSLSSFSGVALHTRTKVIEIMQSDYVLFARARGETGFQIVKRHVLKNAALPAVTLQLASFSELFGGSVLAEQVFSYPGLGQAAVQAGLRSDIPLLLGITLVSAVFVFFGNLLANMVSMAIDPGIREGLRK